MTVSDVGFSTSALKRSRVLFGTGVAAAAVCLTAGLGAVTQMQMNKQQQLAYQDMQVLRTQERYDECLSQAETFSKTHYSYFGLNFDNSVVRDQVQTLADTCQQGKTQKIALQELQKLKADGKYGEVVTKAKAFSDPQSKYYAEATTLLNQSRLAQAQHSAEDNKFLDAITWVKEIPSDSSDYAEAQRLIGKWSDGILEVATNLYQKGQSEDFPKALQIAGAIPKDSLAYDKAQTAMKQWQKDEAQDRGNFDAAKTALGARRWNDALAAANQLQNSPAAAWRKEAQRLIDQAEQAKKQEAEPLNVPNGILDNSSPRLASDNSRYQEHTFKCVAGKTVTITMESSDFETFLIVRTPDGQELTSDRSQSSHTSTVTIPSSMAGTYSIRANARYLYGQGGYILKVRIVS